MCGSQPPGAGRCITAPGKVSGSSRLYVIIRVPLGAVATATADARFQPSPWRARGDANHHLRYDWALRTHRFERYLVIEDQLLTGSGKLTLPQSRKGVVADFGRRMCCLENILRRGDHIF
jgi:hypothetical protein